MKRGIQLEFKQATMAHLDELTQIMADGIQFLKEQKSTQWQDGNGPDKAKIKQDIENQACYILTNEKDQIIGTVALIRGVDPVYTAISQGKWEGDALYCSLHRVAVTQAFRGQGVSLQLLIHSLIEAQKWEIYDVRIDTHALNLPMQKVIQRAGFICRGVVHFPILNGKRLAYQKIIEQNS